MILAFFKPRTTVLKYAVFQDLDFFYYYLKAYFVSMAITLWQGYTSGQGVYEGRSEINASYLFPWKLH